MPMIVNYEDVLARMEAIGLESHYYNSGAFGFPRGVPTHFTGWIGPPDPTIRPAALECARSVPAPHEPTLAALVTRAWLDVLPGVVWLMPKSHWAYELDFGSKDWMPEALRAAGTDPAELQPRTNAAALAFAPAEAGLFTPLVQTLLSHLLGSDFALAFPEHPVTATLHHHKQVWWVSRDAELIRKMEALA